MLLLLRSLRHLEAGSGVASHGASFITCGKDAAWQDTLQPLWSLWQVEVVNVVNYSAAISAHCASGKWRQASSLRCCQCGWSRTS